MVTHNRTMHHATSTELRRPQATLTRITSALLLERLAGRARNFAHALGLVVTGAALGQLPVNHAGNNVRTRGNAENLVRQLSATGGLRIDVVNIKFHRLQPFNAAG